MFSDKPSFDRTATTHRSQTRRLRSALNHLTLGMRELEEQLPLPADRRVRDTTPAQQKARALRVDIEDFNLRLSRISQQIKAMNGMRE